MLAREQVQEQEQEQAVLLQEQVLRLQGLL
jgi:hypothetical protein